MPESARGTIKTYYTLAKPGIIYGNAITAIGGFFLAARGHFSLGLFLAMLFGISFIIASGCVFNNYLDRGIDALMARTKKRALVSGQVTVRNALLYGVVLGFVGIALLLLTNILTLCVALIGLFVYVVVYGLAKRRSVHGTLVGSIAGAVPPVVGYCAVTNRFDLGALLLFLAVAIWQMPHFYAIAMYRLNDYTAANIPVLPALRGMRAAKMYILGYVALFILAAGSLTWFGYTGLTYLVCMVALGLSWLWIGWRNFKSLPDAVWGRKMFFFSLIVITVFSTAITLNTLLP